MTRRRLDTELVRRGIARSRSHASELISAGSVVVAGLPEPKAASLVTAGTVIEPISSGPVYVGRGGAKLQGAIESFGLDPAGLRCLDAGASTGGFTDYLLQRGAASVAAVDVGYGQLVTKLAEDERVTVFDRTNLRHVEVEAVGGPFELAVADLSFISLCTVSAKLAEMLETGGSLVALVKPQFEVGKGRVGRGGVVRDGELHRDAVEKVVACFREDGLGVRAVAPSPVPGAKGNREFFVWAVKGGPVSDSLEFPE